MLRAQVSSKPTRSVSEVHFSFGIRGHTVDVARLAGRLSHNTKLEARRMEHLTGKRAEESWLECVTPWYPAGTALEYATGLVDSLVDLCSNHNCKCISQGVEVR